MTRRRTSIRSMHRGPAQRVRRAARATNRWVGNAAAIVCLTALGVYLGTLASLSPIPSIGIRATWVRAHDAEVRVICLSVVVAIAAAAVTFAVGTRRLVVLGSLIVVGVMSQMVFGEELRLIIKTLAQYRL